MADASAIWRVRSRRTRVLTRKPLAAGPLPLNPAKFLARDHQTVSFESIQDLVDQLIVTGGRTQYSSFNPRLVAGGSYQLLKTFVLYRESGFRELKKIADSI